MAPAPQSRGSRPVPAGSLAGPVPSAWSGELKARRLTSGAGAQWIEDRLAERIIAVATFVVVLNTFSTWLAATESGAESGSMIFQLITLALSCGSLLVLLVRGVPTWLSSLLMQSWPLLLLIALTTLSATWSSAPSITIRRSAALWLTLLPAIMIVARFTVREAMSLFLVAAAIFCVLGFVSAAIPGVGIDQSAAWQGTWRGLLGNKNEFGRYCALIVMLCVAYFVAADDNRRPVKIIGALAFILLVLSRSKTPLVSAMCGLGLALFLRLLFRARVGGYFIGADVRAIGGAASILVAVLSIWYLMPFLLEALGKDATLNGRENIWRFVETAAGTRPWTGFGFRSFWVADNIKYYFYFMPWKAGGSSIPAHSHSSYMDLFVELGYIGIGCASLLLVQCFTRLARAYRNIDLLPAVIFSAVLGFLLLFCVTERTLLQHFEGIFFLFLIGYLYVIRQDAAPAPVHDTVRGLA